jgi:hypothetical protein
VSNDIGPILDAWPYDGSSVSARWIKGRDGNAKIQLRVDLGVLQMEAKGRPDGATPRGFPSLLDYYRDMEAQQTESSCGMLLNADDCSDLQHEALQHYYRYLAYYALHHLDGVIEDTDHNLGILDLVCEHAESEDLVWQFMQFYPYVRMMNARARVEKLIEQEDYDPALEMIEEALGAIEAFHEMYGGDEEFDTTQETEILRELQGQIRSKRPKSREENLVEELNRAIHKENYERAAVLRDALRAMGRPLPNPALHPKDPPA